ncbi:hypothetical protein BDA96_02G121200 [Sorghum bicolor]|uniref:Uncharacterized protein n=1 Tax=Sorghum bicolor TaxID=4558 RepID=A0A921RMW5_SORBI|nr:hypothetical protein BDA96_02G121200 [Sorghum bicolor]KAG0542630.1 hypothetical protein BDA96_02G121200 [Sorghum bicolor]
MGDAASGRGHVVYPPRCAEDIFKDYRAQVEVFYAQCDPGEMALQMQAPSSLLHTPAPAPALLRSSFSSSLWWRRSEMAWIRDGRRGRVSVGGAPGATAVAAEAGPRDSPCSEQRHSERLMLKGEGGGTGHDDIPNGWRRRRGGAASSAPRQLPLHRGGRGGSHIVMPCHRRLFCH